MKKIIFLLIFTFIVLGCSRNYYLDMDQKIAYMVDRVHQYNCMIDFEYIGSERYDIFSDNKGICVMIGEKDSEQVIFLYGKSTKEKYILENDFYSYKTSKEYVSKIFEGFGKVVNFNFHIPNDPVLKVSASSKLYDKMLYSFKISNSSGKTSEYIYFLPYEDELSFYKKIDGEYLKIDDLRKLLE